MPIHNDAKVLTIRRFTNLLDGSIVPKASVSMIIDYYEALKQGSYVVVKKDNCNITNRFQEEEIQEYENEENEYL